MHVTAIKQNGGLFIPNIAERFDSDTIRLIIHPTPMPFDWQAWFDEVKDLSDNDKTFLDNRQDTPPKAVDL